MKQQANIAIVTPWFGADLKGGAEQQAWQVATRLARRGHTVEVVTTCCRSFFDDWSENHHQEGECVESGLLVLRFPVDCRSKDSFDRLNDELLSWSMAELRPGMSPVSDARAAIWATDNINSRALEDWLAENRDGYDAFLFIPYLYGPILNGLPLVADKAWLQPCLHDEAYAYLPPVQALFYAARRLLFNSEGELELAARLYGPMIHAKGVVTGEGIEVTLPENSERLPAALSESPYLLCLGRRCPEKGTDDLVAAFTAYKASHPGSQLYLVLAGPGDTDYANAERDIVDLGLVEESVKSTLLRHCRALCQPSGRESFSRVIFEAWSFGRPVLVNGECLATSVAVDSSQGGWVLNHADAWKQRFAELEAADAGSLQAVGECGRAYAAEMAEWDRVIDRYELLLEDMMPNVTPEGHNAIRGDSTMDPGSECRRVGDDESVIPSGAERSRGISVPPQGPNDNKSPTSGPDDNIPPIHQILPNLSYGDAISNHALQIQAWLRALGTESRIFVGDYLDPRLEHRGTSLVAVPRGTALIYHHSIGSPVTSIAAAHEGPKCLVYHNITPAEFFRPYRPEFARLLRQGREEMWKLARQFPLAVGVSEYNGAELRAFGFPRVDVLPLTVDPGQWDAPADPDVMSTMQDGRRNLLFVGRYSPNKRQDRLIELFAHYRSRVPDSRLVLVGGGEPDDPFVQKLNSLIDAYRLGESVVLTGPVSETALQAYYRTAAIFVSLSEHEGFGVPLLEAMWFDVPVVAARSSAVEETLAGAGVLADTGNLAETARLIERIDNDSALRKRIVTGQRARRRHNLPTAIVPRARALLADLLEQHREIPA